MINKRPRTIQIVLQNGDPSGIRTAEQTISIIRIIEVPRSELANFLKMPESKQVGLYFLISGENKDGLYIGQSDKVGRRLHQHHMNENKEWERALVLVSLTSILTQAHVLYLESLSIEKAKSCQRYELLNGNNGQIPHLPITMKADCDEMHDNASLLLATLGYPIFEPLIADSDNSTEQEQIFICNRAGVKATGIFNNHGMVVLKGSSAPMETNRKTEQRFFDNRDRLIAKGIIEVQENRFVFMRDHLFKTPSGASMFLLLATSNGWKDWKTEKGVNLEDHVGRNIDKTVNNENQ